MSQFTGRRGWVGLAKETTAGVPVTPAMYLPFLECTMQEDFVKLADNSARGIRDIQGENSVVGKKSGKGNLKVVLEPDNIPLLFGATMGIFTSDTNEGNGVYTHLVSRDADNLPLSLSLTFDRVQDRQLFTYCVVDKAQIEFSDGMAMATFDTLSRCPVTTASGTLTTASGTLFSFKDATVQVGSTLTVAQTAAAFRVKDFKLSVNNTAELVYVVGNNDVDSIAHKNFEVSGTVTLYFENTTQRDAYRNNSKNAMVVTLNGAGIGGGLSQFIKFNIYKMRYENYKPDLSIDGLATETFDFVAEYSSLDSKTMDLQVRNRTASY